MGNSSTTMLTYYTALELIIHNLTLLLKTEAIKFKEPNTQGYSIYSAIESHFSYMNNTLMESIANFTNVVKPHMPAIKHWLDQKRLLSKLNITYNDVIAPIPTPLLNIKLDVAPDIIYSICYDKVIRSLEEAMYIIACLKVIYKILSDQIKIATQILRQTKTIRVNVPPTLKTTLHELQIIINIRHLFVSDYLEEKFITQHKTRVKNILDSQIEVIV